MSKKKKSWPLLELLRTTLRRLDSSQSFGPDMRTYVINVLCFTIGVIEGENRLKGSQLQKKRALKAKIPQRFATPESFIVEAREKGTSQHKAVLRYVNEKLAACCFDTVGIDVIKKISGAKRPLQTSLLYAPPRNDVNRAD